MHVAAHETAPRPRSIPVTGPPEIGTRAGSTRGDAAAKEVERGLRISVVVPVLDEVESLVQLHAEVARALGPLGWELILVDDDSTDGTGATSDALAAAFPNVVALHHAARRGQSAALATGIAHARGRLVATLDGDLQNDPADLPAMAARLEDEGLDAVIGFRAERHDSWVRRSSSRVARAVRTRLTGDRARDTGCATRVLTARAARDLPTFDGMHRFIPALLELRGHRYVEVPVGHRPRTKGRSKYGIANRAVRGLVDACAVRWMQSRGLTWATPGVSAHASGEESHAPEQLRRADQR